MRVLLLLFFLLILQSIKSQTNLVPNWSFENIISCPQTEGTSFYSYTPPWFTPNENTPDIYNSCSTLASGCNVPYTWLGYQQAHTGIGYGGFMREDETSCDYLSVKLTSSLQNGKKYCVSFYVNPGNYTSYVIDAIGAYISVDSIYVSGYAVLPFTPQIENPLGNIITDTLNWTEISGEYIAKGGEQFVTIGSFFPDSMIHQAYNDTIHSPGSWPYYFLDDVSVTLCDTDSVGIKNYNNNTQPVVGKIYPNPTKDEAYLDYQIKDGQKGELQFYSVTGKLLSEYKLNSGSSKIIINTTGFSSGIYFYKIIVDQTVIANEKLVIIK